MNWKSLLSAEREYRDYKKSDIRNAFQRDYDRIIFSNIFRRLQNKTQVFPLPGSKMVHNRLTHSLEVASVGRSIAKTASKGPGRPRKEIALQIKSTNNIDDIDEYLKQIDNAIAEENAKMEETQKELSKNAKLRRKK